MEDAAGNAKISAAENGESSSATPLLVIAKHKFEGRNNDELTFAKNDVITVTQRLDGGWWEGSLDGRIGWFPSSYVGLVNTSATQNRVASTGKKFIGGSDNKFDPQLEASRCAYRSEQIKNFVSKERENQQKIERVLNTLNSLEATEKRSHRNEFAFITKCLTEFIVLKRKVLKQFEEQTKNSLNSQFIGKVFLDVAVELRVILLDYCRQHCDLLDLLNQENNPLKQQLSAGKIDLKELIVGLSLVFRHVDKYASILQEIERNTPDGHPDKGNLHRASLVYRDFYGQCERVRRQREAQIDFLRTGTLEQLFDGQSEQLLGSFLYIGKVTLTEPNQSDMGGTEVDRCIAVFGRTILLFEIGTFTGSYVLKSRYTTDSLSVQWKEADNEIRIKNKKKALFVLSTVGKDDFSQLLESLRHCEGIDLEEEDGAVTATKDNSSRGCSADRGATTMTDDGGGGRESNGSTAAVISAPSFSGHFRVNHQLEMILPDDDGRQNGHSSAELFLGNNKTNQGQDIAIPASKPYSGWALRPYPPLRAQWLPSLTNQQSAPIKMRKGLTTEEQEDALMLRIIEGYCISGPRVSSPSASAMPHCCNGRKQPYCQQRNSAESCYSQMVDGGGQVRRAASYPDQHDMAANRPQLIVAEDEKLFVEEMEGDQLIMKERSLVDTVYTLKEQISVLAGEVRGIATALEQEQRARRRIEETVRQITAAGHLPPKPPQQQNNDNA